MRVKRVRIDTRPRLLFPLNDVLHTYYGILHQKLFKQSELNFKLENY